MIEGGFPAKVPLATDGSGDAARAGQAAADLFAGTGAEMHIVHAWHEPAGVLPAPVPMELFQQDAQRLLDREI